MALGDGITWDESVPVDGTNATQIDDYNRDLRVGVRNRMALEHEWPASQAATSEAGKHKFITLQEQGTKPTLSGTQAGALYSKTDHKLYFENSAGTEVTIVAGTAVGDSKVLISATDAAANYLSAKIDTGYLTISGTNLLLATGAIDVYQYTSLSASSQQDAKALKICYGTAATIGANGATSITNLPYADATSYRVSANILSSSAVQDGAISVLNISGAECSLVNQAGATLSINWIGIGV